jgi:serine-type D-Ala-D-Ala carboxypeptidase/endopeptidase
MRPRNASVLKIALLMLCVMIVTETEVISSQTPAGPQAQRLVGDYSSEIGSQLANLRFKMNLDGTLRGTLDHLDPTHPWMFALTDIQFDGQLLKFTVPFIDAKFEGSLAADGGKITGTWTQKNFSLLVEFALRRFILATHPSALDGIWLEVQKSSETESGRNQLVFRSDATGHEYCTLDQLDVYTMDEECSNVTLNANEVSFAVPVAGLRWKGQLAIDGNRLVGNWSQSILHGQSTREAFTASDFHRQVSLSAEKPRPHAVYDEALPPVDVTEIQAVLEKDIAGALKSKDLAPGTSAGVTIAVYEHGTRRIFCYGEARPDSIYEIGSMTKTFTGLLLAQMAVQGKAQLNEPVRELLPAGAVAKPDGPEITLLDLATQRSGLPPMPDNVSVANMDQPYADYHVADLMNYLGRHGVRNPTQTTSPFGSLGFGLLGVALANRAGKQYSDLLHDEITGPLGLKDTALTLDPEQQARLIQGHDQFHKPAKVWESDAFEGGIGLRSTAGDLLTFLEANLNPERAIMVPGFAAGATLKTALRQSLETHGEVAGRMQIALGWIYQPETGNYWHNGATAAHSMYAFFNPKSDYAAVVLYNTSPGLNGSFAEVLGRHISQRLAGTPAISLTQF